METATVTFEQERETDNTIRFKEVAPPGQPKVMGSVYVQKWALHQMGNPARITVTVTAQ